jgi:hypothetical protein
MVSVKVDHETADKTTTTAATAATAATATTGATSTTVTRLQGVNVRKLFFFASDFGAE